jgi:serine O-acetyltransferase
MQKPSTQSIAETLAGLYSTEHVDHPENVLWNYPAPERVIKALQILIDVMFPGIALGSRRSLAEQIDEQLAEVTALLSAELKRAIPFRWQSAASAPDEPVIDDVPAEAARVLNEFLNQLPIVRKMLIEDVKAAYNGDPAALSYAEVKVAYPGVLAITSHRIAHELYRLNVPIIPRIMNEWTHSKAGIDIHPGATIDRGFFIDHGTGVVIGETARIGKGVKIYQGVTLGAKSFPLDEHGNPIKHIQRHPTVEDNVIIYSNTTILGGKTVIGHDSVIGGNVFLMETVPPHSFVTKTGGGASVLTKDTTHLLGGLGI